MSQEQFEAGTDLVIKNVRQVAKDTGVEITRAEWLTTWPADSAILQLATSQRTLKALFLGSGSKTWPGGRPTPDLRAA